MVSKIQSSSRAGGVRRVESEQRIFEHRLGEIGPLSRTRSRLCESRSRFCNARGFN